MAFWVDIDHVRVKCDSAQDVAELVRVLRTQGNGKKPVPAKTEQAPSNREDAGKGRVIQFLTFVRNAGEEGANGLEMTGYLGIDGVKGLGGFVSTIRRELIAAGLKPEDVFDRKRTKEGWRWFGRMKLEEALTTLQQG
jgi:hypothetical protein